MFIKYKITATKNIIIFLYNIMTIIAGLNNRGVSLTIQIEGQDVIIPPGKFVIQKNNGIFVAVKPPTSRYAKVGQDLGCVSFQTNSLTFVSEVPCSVNVGQFDRIFGAGLTEPEALAQGLNMCSNLFEAIPGGGYDQEFAINLWTTKGINGIYNCEKGLEYSSPNQSETLKINFGDSISRFRIPRLVEIYKTEGRFGWFKFDGEGTFLSTILNLTILSAITITGGFLAGSGSEDENKGSSGS
jgi:hypothetical protein